MFEHVWLQGHLESVPVILLSHGLKTARETFGIAELTSRTYLRAPRYRVPSRIGPFDMRVIRQVLESLLLAILFKNVFDNAFASLLRRCEEQVINRCALAVEESQRSWRVRKTSNIEQPLAVGLRNLLVGVLNLYLLFFTKQVHLPAHFIRHFAPGTIAPKTIHSRYLRIFCSRWISEEDA